MKQLRMFRKRFFKSLTVIVASTLVVAIAPLFPEMSSTAHASGQYTLSGYVRAGNPMSGDIVPNSQIELDDSSNASIATGVSGLDGSYSLAGIPSGTFELKVTPPTGSGYLAYSASVDVFQDTDFNAALRSSSDSMAFVSGRMLVNGGAPGDYFESSNISPSLSGKVYVTGTGFEADIVVDPTTGNYSFVTPKNLSLDMNVNFQAGFGVLSKGMQNMSPKLIFTEDTFKVFDVQTTSNSTSFQLHVADQCGNPLPGAQVDAEVAAYLPIAQGITAEMYYNPGATPLLSTNSTGDVSFPFQLDNVGGILRVGYGSAYKEQLLDLIHGQSSFTIVLNLQQCLGPVLGTPTWTINPKAASQNSTLIVPVSDPSGAGITSGEYYLGDSDPGKGMAAPMMYANGNLTAVFGTMPAGVYSVHVRAENTVGDWGQPVTDYLVVYDPSGPSITGKQSTVPSLANSDVLPGLNQSGQTDKSVFAFTVKYDNSGAIAGSSGLKFSYSTGTCKGQNQTNCHNFSMNSSGVDWLVIDGTNQSEGIFQGSATVTVDGVTTTNPYKVVATDSTKLGSGNDHLQLLVYAVGANPSTASPIYKISDDVSKGGITIR
jgi:hypothetical protein